MGNSTKISESEVGGGNHGGLKQNLSCATAGREEDAGKARVASTVARKEVATTELNASNGIGGGGG